MSSVCLQECRLDSLSRVLYFRSVPPTAYRQKITLPTTGTIPFDHHHVASFSADFCTCGIIGGLYHSDAFVGASLIVAVHDSQRSGYQGCYQGRSDWNGSHRIGPFGSHHKGSWGHSRHCLQPHYFQSGSWYVENICRPIRHTAHRIRNKTTQCFGISLFLTLNCLCAHTAAKQYNIPKFTSEAMDVITDPEVDAVWICSPSQYHAEQIKACAANKKHVFCGETRLDICGSLLPYLASTLTHLFLIMFLQRSPLPPSSTKPWRRSTPVTKPESNS